MKTRIHSMDRLPGRLLLLVALLVGFGLLASRAATPVHATTTLTVTNCTNDSQLQADVSTANSDNANDTITFACRGDIVLTNTLSISGSMTIDGSGQSVTLDGGNSLQVLNVNSGVSLTLNALTVAHGSVVTTGGGLFNGGTVNITNSTFASNSAPEGGGLENVGGTVNVTNSTFASNSVTGDGGGLYSSGTLNISNSTFSANHSGTVGGGIINDGGQTSITNSTFANNSAYEGGGLYTSGTLSIGGSIVANNTSGDCFIDNSAITDNGYNLSSDSSCGFTGTGDLQNTNPQLSTLANNGGPTQTMALQQGSPAIDAGPPSGSCPTTDQRGMPRPDNGEATCDIGAYEFQDPSLTVNGTKVSATEGAAFSGQVASGAYSGSGTLSATINWGDGSATSSGSISGTSSFTVSGSHTYAEEGSYTITISVSDGQGQNASTTGAATVSDAALTLTSFVASPLGHLSAGLAATFTDADPGGTVSDYTTTIKWGDGSTSTVKAIKNPIGKGFALAGLHSYSKKGTYTITLTVADQGGSQVSKTVNLTVK